MPRRSAVPYRRARGSGSPIAGAEIRSLPRRASGHPADRVRGILTAPQVSDSGVGRAADLVRGCGNRNRLRQDRLRGDMCRELGSLLGLQLGVPAFERMATAGFLPSSSTNNSASGMFSQNHVPTMTPPQVVGLGERPTQDTHMRGADRLVRDAHRSPQFQRGYAITHVSDVGDFTGFFPRQESRGPPRAPMRTANW